MWLTCKEATALVSQALDRKLTAWQRFVLRLHLLMCDACRNFVKQSAFMRRALRRLTGGDDPP